MVKLLLFLTLAFLWLLILVLSWFIIIYLRKRNAYFLQRLTRLQIAGILIFIGICGSGYMTWLAYHPSDTYYISELKRMSEINWPLNAEVEIKGVSFPLEDGQYSLAAIVRLDSIELYRLLAVVKENPKFREEEDVYHIGKSISEKVGEDDFSKTSLVFKKYDLAGGSYLGNIAFDIENGLVAFEKVVWE